MSRKFSNLEVTKQLITITQSHKQNYKFFWREKSWNLTFRVHVKVPHLAQGAVHWMP